MASARRPAFPSLIGVIHLPALAGAPGSQGLHPASALERAGLRAVSEAQVLTRAGFDGLILENFGDVPFYKECVPPETVACMAVIAAAVKESVRVPVGVNVLRNDARSALAIASVTGCEFLRVNVLSGVAAADQGLLEGRAALLARERMRLGANPWIFADAQVKHARTLSSDDVEASVSDLTSRALADAVVVTGAATGSAAAPERVEAAHRSARRAGVPLYLGSGVSHENISGYADWIQGVIVSSDLRRGGRAGQPLDPARIRRLVQAFRRARARRRKPLR